MLSKIAREDYYDDEYILNEQEFKGFSSSTACIINSH